MWEMLQKDIPNTHLDEPKQQLRTKRAELDHVVIAVAIRQWHRQWVHTFSCIFRTRYNQMDSNLANLDATVKLI